MCHHLLFNKLDMETPDKEDNVEMPGYFGDESGHSEGFYGTRSEHDEENKDPESPKEPDQPDQQQLHDSLVKAEVRKKSAVAFTVFGLMLFLFISVTF